MCASVCTQVYACTNFSLVVCFVLDYVGFFFLQVLLFMELLINICETFIDEFVDSYADFMS